MGKKKKGPKRQCLIYQQGLFHSSVHRREEKKQQLCFSKCAVQAVPWGRSCGEGWPRLQPLTGAKVLINVRTKRAIAV